jgi:calcium-dependent protein kinase
MTGVYGTSFFLAPEVIEHSYSEKCDVWSCGVVLYMMLSGHPPFDGRDDLEVIKKVLNGKFDLDSELWSHMSPEVKDLLGKMLTREGKRLSAKDVLHHPWFDKCAKSEN